MGFTPSFSRSSKKATVEKAKVGKPSLPAVGVDIGSGSVRAVRVSKVDKDGFAVIDRFGIAQIASDAVETGHIKKPQMVATALLKALQAAGSSKNVVVGINVPEQVVARLALPSAIKHDERADSIRATSPQLGATLQLSDAELDLNFVRQENAPDGRTMAAVIAAGVHQEQLQKTLEVCRLANVTPRAVDLTAAGTLRSLVRDLPTSTDVAAVVDVGATATTVIIREGLFLRSVRVIPGGGLMLTRALASVMRDHPDAAEQRKMRMAVPEGVEAPVSAPPQNASLGFDGVLDSTDTYQDQLADRTHAERGLAQAVEQLIDQIASAIEADASSMGVPTPHVALCGGTALLRGFRQHLARRLRVEVLIGHPWARLADKKEHADYMRDGREDPRLMLSLATASGLALWRPVR